MVETGSSDTLSGAVELLKSLASPIRLAVVVELSSGPRCVHELQKSLETSGRVVSQPLLSQHLKVLRQAELVDITRRGSEITYQLVDEHVMHIVNDAIRHSQEETDMTDTHSQHADHDHVHGEGCGHLAIPHNDHVDYLHDGHLHTAHDGHFDECTTDGHSEHADHDHVHGEGCGHAAIPHEDHVDYLHEGHRHAAHEGNWDEH